MIGLNNNMKITIIGAGNVGATTAYAILLKNLAAEVILIDINDKKEAGEVWDIADGLGVLESGGIRQGNFADARAADVLIITAGLAQRAGGGTRLDLFAKNKEIMTSIFTAIGPLDRQTIVLVITNPVDALVAHVQKISGLPRTQVFGSGTTLDTARLRRCLSERLNVSPRNVHGYVLGEHGDSGFVAWSTVTVGGVPVIKLPGFSPALAEEVEIEIRQSANKIIARKGATFYGIATVITKILEAILADAELVLPVSTRLTNWNGVSGVCLGAPAVIGRRGIVRHWPLSLTATEKKKLRAAARVIKCFS